MTDRCPHTVGFNWDGNAVPILCGRWSCPRCRRGLAGTWAKRALLAFPQSEAGETARLWFLTLTLGPQYRTAVQGYAGIPRLWDTTRKLFQRRWEVFTYMAFVEGQPLRAGMPHFHVLAVQLPPCAISASRRPTSHALHDWAFTVGWGFQVKLEHVRGPRAASYVAKYASKAAPSMPPSFRRVRVSRDWPKLPDPPIMPLILPGRHETFNHFITRAALALRLDPALLTERFYAAQR